MLAKGDLSITEIFAKPEIQMLSLRLLALTVDLFTFWLLFKIFMYILLFVFLLLPIMILGSSEAWVPENNIGHWIFFGMVALFTLREFRFRPRHRHSLGKGLLGIEVVDTKTQKPASIWRHFIRNSPYFLILISGDLLMLYMVFEVAALVKNPQRFIDHIARTKVQKQIKKG